MNNLHGIIFAYRENTGLRELTQNRNTCSIPYGGRYRLVDFALSNLVNAGVSDIGLIVQSSYQSLLDHVGSGKDWDLSRKHGGLRILPPFSFSAIWPPTCPSPTSSPAMWKAAPISPPSAPPTAKSIPG